METTNPFGFSAFLAQSDALLWTVMIALLAMSLASWYLIITKTARGWRIRRAANAFAVFFWQAPSLEAVTERLEQRTPHEPFARVAQQGIQAAAHYDLHAARRLGEACMHDEFVTRAIRHGIARETARLESGLTVLASVGSTAPFIGLFGTVWGIYHALAAIGASGEATLERVAGPVGEALIMTALGLAVAIPAVLAYNALVRHNRVLLDELDGFAHDLHSFLTTGAKMITSHSREARRSKRAPTNTEAA